MALKLLLASLLAIIIGFVLGCVPVLNENLHWNLWYVIPISGLLFGCAIGSIQFLYCFKMDQIISRIALVCLAVSALVGYATVDYGIYRSMSVIIEDHESIPDGEYKLSELMSFWQYMRLNLGGSTVDTRFGDDMEIGAIGTTISYIVDLLGATAGATITLLFYRKKYPFCKSCDRYKKREQKYKIKMIFEEDTINQIFTRLDELINGGVYKDIVKYCCQFAHDYNDSKGDVKINIDQRYCPMCLEATIIGTMYKKSGSNWNEVKDLNFLYTSQKGEHVSLGTMGESQESENRS